MAHAGLHTYIALKLKNKFSIKKYYFSSFILGAILPDIDIVITLLLSIFTTIEKSIFLTHKTFSHSILILILILISFLIIYEITNNKIYLNIGRGLSLGILLHIIMDLTLEFSPISLFWPLPIKPFNIWNGITLSAWLSKFLMAIEFVFFRLFAWKLIEMLISTPTKNGYLLKSLNKYMKAQLFFIILFCISGYFIHLNTLYYLFVILYVPSILIMIYFIYKLQDNFNQYIALNNDIENEEPYLERRTPIKNIE